MALLCCKIKIRNDGKLHEHMETIGYEAKPTEFWRKWTTCCFITLAKKSLYSTEPFLPTKRAWRYVNWLTIDQFQSPIDPQVVFLSSPPWTEHFFLYYLFSLQASHTHVAWVQGYLHLQFNIKGVDEIWECERLGMTRLLLTYIYF